jgi:hypothetical protein
MSINTTYDSQSELLRINSGNAGKTSGASANSTTTTANSESSTTDTDSASWSSLALALSDSDSEYISPILKLKSQNETLQTQLTKTLAAKFEDLGVDTSQTITLGRDADGNVVVQGDNADKDKIEQLFADTPALTEAFNTLADNSTTLKNMNSSQSASLVRTNGYAAYLNQLTNDSSSDDYLLSMLGDSSTSYFS